MYTIVSLGNFLIRSGICETFSIVLPHWSANFLDQNLLHLRQLLLCLRPEDQKTRRAIFEFTCVSFVYNNLAIKSKLLSDATQPVKTSFGTFLFKNAKLCFRYELNFKNFKIIDSINFGIFNFSCFNNVWTTENAVRSNKRNKALVKFLVRGKLT